VAGEVEAVEAAMAAAAAAAKVEVVAIPLAEGCMAPATEEWAAMAATAGPVDLVGLEVVVATLILPTGFTITPRPLPGKWYGKAAQGGLEDREGHLVAQDQAAEWEGATGAAVAAPMEGMGLMATLEVTAGQVRVGQWENATVWARSVKILKLSEVG
jgi:hypothetical protein